MNKTKSIALLIALAGLHGQVYADQFRLTYLLNQTIPHNPWKDTTPYFTDWKETSTPYSCKNWSPSPSTVGKGITFTQTADDCQQEEKRTVRPRQIDEQGNTQYTPGAAFDQIRYVTVTHSRDAMGIVENWLAYEPILGNWVDTNKLYGCTQWTPSPDAYLTTTSFSQSSSNCSTDQERDRQEREQESNTHDIRNSGEITVDKQTLGNQKASRSYTVNIGPWVNVGTMRDCSNWSPARETVSTGVDFTQSATDCKQDQERTRSESYTDHKSGVLTPVSSITQKQTLEAQKGTQTATGTAQNPSVNVTAPSLVFAQAPFTLNWSGSNASQYTLTANSNNSGVSTSETNATGRTTLSVTPTVPGSYDYTVKATNTAGVTISDTKRVVVASDPAYVRLNVNNSPTISVSPNAALSFTASGLSDGAAIQGRNAANDADQLLPANASGTEGTSTYYASAKKTINGVTRYSGIQSVAVTVVGAPTISSFTIPAKAYVGRSTTFTWAGTNVSSYSIRADKAGSGFATTDTALSGATSTSVSPTIAGTYNLTLTGTNSVGVSISSTQQVTIQEPSAEGTYSLGGPAGLNTAIQITNGRAFNTTSTGLSKGIVQQVGISIGNYVNKANGLVTLNVCSPSACTTASLNMAGTVDNAMLPFVFANPLTLAKGDSLTMTFTGSGSTYPAAIWTYSTYGAGMGTPTTIGTTNAYANMTITYKSGVN